MGDKMVVVNAEEFEILKKDSALLRYLMNEGWDDSGAWDETVEEFEEQYGG
jgi:hypothetical protein